MVWRNLFRAFIALAGLTLLVGGGAAARTQNRSLPAVEAGPAIRRVEPRYPDEARQTGVSGFVMVQVIVDERGNVESAEAISGSVLLRRAAEEAAMRWKFKPAKIAGAAVKSLGRIAFHFELRSAARLKGETTMVGLTVAADSPLFKLSGKERRRIRKSLGKSRYLDIPVKLVDGCPIRALKGRIKYTEARIRGLDQQDSYFTRIEIELANHGDERATAAGIEFVNNRSGSVFYVYPDSISIGKAKHRTITIKFMSLREDPSSLAVAVVGAEFANGVVWGWFPFPPEPKPFLTVAADAPIDAPPKILTRALPAYTEDARSHGVLGAVGLRILVGPEGHVQDVRVTNPLPDGLTWEAVRSVRGSLFKPALSNGVPASCWLNLNIEFKGK